MPIDVTIEADSEGLATLRTRLAWAGVVDPTLVPLANVLRVVADLLDKRADFVQEEQPIMLGTSDLLTFKMRVMP